MGPCFLAGAVNVATRYGQIQQRPLLQASRPWYSTPVYLSGLYPLLQEVWRVITDWELFLNQDLTVYLQGRLGIGA